MSMDDKLFVWRFFIWSELDFEFKNDFLIGSDNASGGHCLQTWDCSIVTTYTVRFIVYLRFR